MMVALIGPREKWIRFVRIDSIIWNEVCGDVYAA